MPLTPPVAPRKPAPDMPALRYYVVDQDVADVLATLGRLSGTGVTLQGRPEGRLRSTWLNGPLSAVMANLSSRFGFFYIFDGSRYVVTTKESSHVAVAEVADASFDRALQLMSHVFPETSPGAIAPDPYLGVVYLRGPSNFLDTATTILGRESAPGHVRLIRNGVATVARFGEDEPETPPKK